VNTPKDLASAVKVMNLKTGNFKDATAKTSLQKGKEKFVFLTEFLVKDYTNFMKNSFIKVVLALDSNHKFFPNLTPEDILKKAKARTAVAASLDILQKFNVWIEASVRMNSDGQILITD
jgi:hypothetical protein